MLARVAKNARTQRYAHHSELFNSVLLMITRMFSYSANSNGTQHSQTNEDYVRFPLYAAFPNVLAHVLHLTKERADRSASALE